MFKKTKTILTFATFLSSTGISLASGSSYMGGSIGVGGLGYTSIGKRISVSGLNGGIFGGYGATYGIDQKWYLGGELNANIAGGGSTINYGLGASLMPGMMITKSTLLYTRVGMEAAYYPQTHTSTGNTGKLLKFGPVAGLGVQTELTKKVSLRAEYDPITVRNSGVLNLGLVYKFI